MNARGDASLSARVSKSLARGRVAVYLAVMPLTSVYSRLQYPRFLGQPCRRQLSRFRNWWRYGVFDKAALITQLLYISSLHPLSLSCLYHLSSFLSLSAFFSLQLVHIQINYSTLHKTHTRALVKAEKYSNPKTESFYYSDVQILINRIIFKKLKSIWLNLIWHFPWTCNSKKEVERLKKQNIYCWICL